MKRNDISLQDIFDELDEIVGTLDNLIDSIHLKDYKESLETIKYEAMIERDDAEEQLEEEYDREQKEMDRQFIMERI